MTADDGEAAEILLKIQLDGPLEDHELINPPYTRVDAYQTYLEDRIKGH